MNQYYFSPTTLAFYPESLKEDYIKSSTWPIDAVEVSYEIFNEFALTPAPANKQKSSENNLPIWIDTPAPSQEILTKRELLWIESEFNRVRDELEKVQDSDPRAVGTVTDWRNYRKSLRSWQDHPNFPKQDSRPIAPDV